MSIASSVTLDWKAQTSTFHYAIAGGLDRTLSYDNSGFVTLPAVEVGAAPIALDDFEALVTAISNWITLLGTQFTLPLSAKPSTATATRSTGARPTPRSR